MAGIDFKSGKIIYDEFHVDFTKSFLEQIDSLKEDLLQVKYTDDYLLDLGWYPEYKVDGKFVVQLIKDRNWDAPVYRACCKSQEQLRQILETAINFVSK